MEIVNVVRLNGGVLNDIRSWVIPTNCSTDKRDAISAKAEKQFKDYILEENPDEEDEIIENCMDDGTYDDHNGFEVLLTWSEVMN